MMSKSVAILDANVLYAAPLRDLLMWLGVEEVFLPKWTNQIHEEWIEAILRNRSDLDRTRLARTRDKMNLVMPDSLVIGVESLIPTLRLPDKAF